MKRNSGAAEPQLSSWQPWWLWAMWLCLIVPGAFAAVEIALARTYLPWRDGPENVSYGLFHSELGFLALLAMFLLAIWVVVAVLWAWRARSRRGLRRLWLTIAATALVAALPHDRSGLLESATIVVLGPGSHANSQMVEFAAYGRRMPIRSLMRRGVSVNVQDSEGRSPLMAAAVGADARFVTWVLDQGAEVNARDKSDGTALAAAVEMNSPAVVEVLLSRGADVRVREANGATPLDVARQRGDPRIIALIEKALAMR